jgi:hypothetical protein
MRETHLPPRTGVELRPHRAPSLKNLVKHALKCDSAEQIGKKLRQRFERQQRRGIETGRSRQADVELDEQVERLLGG